MFSEIKEMDYDRNCNCKERIKQVWVLISHQWEYVENNMSSDISWRKFAFRVSDYVSLTNNIQLKFIASDSIRPGQYLDGGSLIEAAVDDLVLYEEEATTSVSDLLSTKPNHKNSISNIIKKPLHF